MATMAQVHDVTMPLGTSPARIFCPKCCQTVLSKVDFSSRVLTFLLVTRLCIIGFALAFLLFPFGVHRLKDAIHTCPACKTQLGAYKHLFVTDEGSPDYCP